MCTFVGHFGDVEQHNKLTNAYAWHVTVSILSYSGHQFVMSEEALLDDKASTRIWHRLPLT